MNHTVSGRAMPIGDDLYQSIMVLCTFIKDRDIRSLLVVGKQRTIHSVSLVANPMGIPVLGYTTDMADKFVQVSFSTLKSLVETDKLKVRRKLSLYLSYLA